MLAFFLVGLRRSWVAAAMDEATMAVHVPYLEKLRAEIFPARNSEVTEFNVHADPEAAAEVFAARLIHHWDGTGARRLLASAGAESASDASEVLGAADGGILGADGAGDGALAALRQVGHRVPSSCPCKTLHCTTAR